jgi:heme exporter protein C
VGALVPADVVQGEIQKLMYVHVPAAWCAYLCVAVALAVNVWFLRRPTRRAWVIGGAAGEVAVALVALTLLTGSVWGAATWGTWWTWDARVTSTTALGLVYVAYLALRSMAGTPRLRTAAAIVGAGGFVLVPIVHFSVVWFRTLHQPATILAPSLTPPIDSRMLIALALAVVAASVVTGGLLRWRIGRAERRRSQRRAPVSRAGRSRVLT